MFPLAFETRIFRCTVSYKMSGAQTIQTPFLINDDAASRSRIRHNRTFPRLVRLFAEDTRDLLFISIVGSEQGCCRWRFPSRSHLLPRLRRRWWRNFLFRRSVSHERTFLSSQQLQIKQLQHMIKVPSISVKIFCDLETDNLRKFFSKYTAPELYRKSQT